MIIFKFYYFTDDNNRIKRKAIEKVSKINEDLSAVYKLLLF